LTHIETPIGSIPYSINKLVDSINPCQMKTYAISRQSLKPIIPSTPSFHPYLKSEILRPILLDTQRGSVVGSLDSLGLLEQNGSSDDPSTYVVFSPTGSSYVGYQSFYLPEKLHPSNISNILLQVNYKDPDPSQIWIWSVFSWNSKRWVRLGDAAGGNTQWSTLLFRINNPWLYISSTNEIHIQLSSNNSTSGLKIDYEALHVTYKSSEPLSEPIVPTVPPDRPGIASTSS